MRIVVSSANGAPSVCAAMVATSPAFTVSRLKSVVAAKLSRKRVTPSISCSEFMASVTPSV